MISLRLAVLALIFLPKDASAQQLAVGVDSVSYHEALASAIEADPTHIRSQSEIELYRLQTEQARAERLPELQVNVGTTSSVGRNFNVETGALNTSLANYLSGGVSVDIDPSAWFRTRSATRRLASLSVSSRAEGDRAIEIVAAEIALGFVALAAAEAGLKSAVEASKRQRSSVATAEGLVRAGLRPTYDIFVARSALVDARVDSAEAERIRIIARVDLLRLSHLLDRAEEVGFRTPDLSTLEGLYSDLDVEATVRHALDERPDLRADQARIAAQDAAVRTAQLARLPSVRVGIGARSSYSDSDPDNFFNQLTSENPRGSLSLSVGIPILDFGRIRRGVEEARIQRRNLEDAAAERNYAVTAEVHVAVASHAAAVAAVALSTERLALAQTQERVAEERYRTGGVDAEELTQARAALTRAVSGLVQARFNLVSAVIEVAVVTGDPQPLLDRLLQ